ncbi:class I SAM-dependent methyltransferase [Chloroflexota bacterium]
MERHLEETKLVQQLDWCIAYLKNTLGQPLHGIGVDLASGNLWAVPYLLNAGQVNRVYCVDYSEHRLLKLGPKVLEHYNIPKDKVYLCLGSFYELKLPDQSLDFVLLAEAFHHADKPHDLLAEIRRVLKPHGVVLIIGEHIIAPSKLFRLYIIHLVKFLISSFVPKSVQAAIFGRTFSVKTMLPKQGGIIPPDPILGDHYYSVGEYRAMVSQHGFKYCNVKLPSGFVLIGN